MENKSIYIILMDTKTLLSRIIKLVTRYKYSHVVLSLDDSYTKLYSFGRKQVYNFLNAGFVTYGINSSFFKTYHNTECIIYELKVTSEQYDQIKSVIEEYEENMDIYKYDIMGLLIRYFYTKANPRENYYVCSQFVATVLQAANICDFDKPVSLVKPHDFCEIPDVKPVYEGCFLELKRK